SYMLPDRYKLELSADVGGQKLTVNQTVKGESIKSKVTFGGMTVPSDTESERNEVKTAAVLQEAEQLTPLLDAKKFTIKAGDDDTDNGKKATLVIVKPKAIDKELKIYFDKETGLIVKTAHKGMGPGPAGTPIEVMEEEYPTDYKKVSGVQVATKLMVTHD